MKKSSLLLVVLVVVGGGLGLYVTNRTVPVSKVDSSAAGSSVITPTARLSVATPPTADRATTSQADITTANLTQPVQTGGQIDTTQPQSTVSADVSAAESSDAQNAPAIIVTPPPATQSDLPGSGCVAKPHVMCAQGTQ